MGLVDLELGIRMAWQSVCVSRCRGPHGRFLPTLAVGTFQSAVDNPVVGTFQSAVDRPFLYRNPNIA